MKLYHTLATVCLAMGVSLGAVAQTAEVTLKLDEANGTIIPKEIYGQFSEHLGSCIYGGLWVGPESDIPNYQGYRLDVLNALRELKIPVMRWPGGCFADDYHWMDGIGPKEKRTRIGNSNWGGTIEDNSFGTHEFLNLCEILGCDAYISGNVGSGSVEEMSKWVEYMTSDTDSDVANLRRKNGREEPWKVKYFGVGNEAWGCGGHMRPEYYIDLYRRYATYLHNYADNKLFKVACGASDYDYKWTESMMKGIGRQMHGISVHYYTVRGWDGSKGSATQFTDKEYYWTLLKSTDIENVIRKHSEVMDKYDPKKRIALMVDEWGTWWDVEPGTNEGHLFQHTTMRDALVAALSLNIFHRYTDRVKMTNIAQVVNVLQSMINTRGNQMVLTPTYHVFNMYKVHQDAEFIPTEIESKVVYTEKGRYLEEVSATASRKDGIINIALVNCNLKKETKITVKGSGKGKVTSATVLTSKDVHDYNDFGQETKVAPAEFKNYKVTKEGIELTIPADAIVTLSVTAK